MFLVIMVTMMYNYLSSAFAKFSAFGFDVIDAVVQQDCVLLDWVLESW